VQVERVNLGRKVFGQARTNVVAAVVALSQGVMRLRPANKILSAACCSYREHR
jgi:hypothetical protein